MILEQMSYIESGPDAISRCRIVNVIKTLVKSKYVDHEERCNEKDKGGNPTTKNPCFILLNNKSQYTSFMKKVQEGTFFHTI